MESSAFASLLESRKRVASRRASSVTATASAASRRIASGFSAERALGRDHRRKSPGIGDAAADHLQQAAVGHRRAGCDRAVGDQQLQHLHAHALGRQRRKPARAADAGEIAVAVDVAGAEGGMDAEEAQDAQIILFDALPRRRR